MNQEELTDVSPKPSLLRRFEFRGNESQRAATCEAVTSRAAITGSYLAINAAVTLLAGFGLIQNSPAVIIGAMLIAMLFDPIVGIAPGLAEANMPLLAVPWCLKLWASYGC